MIDSRLVSATRSHFKPAKAPHLVLYGHNCTRVVSHATIHRRALDTVL